MGVVCVKHFEERARVAQGLPVAGSSSGYHEKPAPARALKAGIVFAYVFHGNTPTADPGGGKC